VKGMSLQSLDVLVAAGIDGPKRLFSYTQEALVKHLAQMAAEKKVTGTLPTAEEIAAWFANPRPGTNGAVATDPKPEAGTKPEGAIVH